MKIKEFHIMQYGPLPEIKFKLGKFNLFYGENERGKTLTIEALIRFLLGTNVDDFVFIDRIKEEPSGYILIENENGEYEKITPLKRDLFQKFTGLTEAECRNLFIIRNSDLAIKESESFYSQITEKLTGIQTRPILNIKKKIHELGQITDTDQFSDKKEDNKLKSRLNKAQDCLNKINSFFIETEENNDSDLEFNLIKKKEKQNLLEIQIEQLFDAQNREKYENGIKKYEKVIDLQKKLKEYELINLDGIDKWRNSLTKLESYIDQKNQISIELDNEKKNLEEIEDLKNKKDDELKKLKNEKDIIEETQKSLDKYQNNLKNLKSEEKKTHLTIVLLLILGVIWGISLIGLIYQPVYFLYFALFSGVGFTAVVFYIIFHFRRRKILTELFEDIKYSMARLGKEFHNIKEVLVEIESFNLLYNNIVEENKQLEWRIRELKERIKKKEEVTLPQLYNNIKEIEEIINKIKFNSGINEINVYQLKLKEKSDLERKLSKNENTLDSIFDISETKDISEKLIEWADNINNLEIYKEKALNIQYNRQIEREVREELKIVSEECKKIENNLKSFRNKLRDFQNLVQQILIDEQVPMICDSFSDISKLKDNLIKFIEFHEQKRQIAIKAFNILDQIEKEEKQKISKIFEDQLLIETFNKITGDLYSEIIYDPEENLKVTLKTGKTLYPEQISSGAYDQLYFSIRLALSKKVLGDRLGFFILDDPFIKSDINRLYKKLKILYDLTKEGWQILYFTAKNEVKEFFEKNNLIDEIKLYQYKSDILSDLENPVLT